MNSDPASIRAEAAERPDKARRAGGVRRFLFVNRKAPYGTAYASESIEVVLMAAAFDQDVSLAFLDDGVYQLVKAQNPRRIQARNLWPAYRALEDYEVDKIYVERESLEARGLTQADLAVEAKLLSAHELAQLMDGTDVVIGF